MNKKISVVIPTKNRPFFLECLLRPFKGFTDNIELIVADDESTPALASKNRELCDAFIECYYIYLSKSKGSSAARNIGLSKCSSTYVWFIDDDDQVSREIISDVLKTISITSSDVFLLPSKTKKNNLVLGDNIPLPEKQNFEYYKKYGHCVNTSCAIINRKKLLEIGGWDEKLVSGQDTSLFLSLSKKSNFKVLETEPVIINVGHAGRITSNILKQQVGKIQFLRKHWNDLHIRRRLYYIVSFIICLPAFHSFRMRWAVYKNENKSRF